MSGWDELRDRVRQHGGELTKRGSDLLVDRLRDEAGPTLRPETIQLSTPQFTPERWSTTLTVTGVGTVWQWQTGDPANPFEPHHAAELDGAIFDESNYLEVLAKDPGVFPTGNTFWFPGDHSGCTCVAANLSGDDPFNPGGVRTTATTLRLPGGATATVTRGPATVGLVPEWWAQIVNPQGWREALEDVMA